MKTFIGIFLLFAGSMFAQTAPQKRPFTFEDMMALKRVGATSPGPGPSEHGPRVRGATRTPPSRRLKGAARPGGRTTARGRDTPGPTYRAVGRDTCRDGRKHLAETPAGVRAANGRKIEAAGFRVTDPA